MTESNALAIVLAAPEMRAYARAWQDALILDGMTPAEAVAAFNAADHVAPMNEIFSRAQVLLKVGRQAG